MKLTVYQSGLHSISTPYIILFMPKSLSLFIKTHLFLFFSFPSLQILPVKNTGEKMRGRNGGEQNLSEEKGPLSEPPFLQRMCPEMEGDERSKRKKMLSILSKDRSFFYSKREANREAGCGLDWRKERIDGGGQVVSNTKADERSLLAE